MAAARMTVLRRRAEVRQQGPVLPLSAECGPLHDHGYGFVADRVSPRGAEGGTSAGFSAAPGRDGSSAVGGGVGFFSSQTFSMRQPLNRLFTMIASPFTCGCRQVAK